MLRVRNKNRTRTAAARKKRTLRKNPSASHARGTDGFYHTAPNTPGKGYCKSFHYSSLSGQGHGQEYYRFIMRRRSVPAVTTYIPDGRAVTSITVRSPTDCTDFTFIPPTV